MSPSQISAVGYRSFSWCGVNLCLMHPKRRSVLYSDLTSLLRVDCAADDEDEQEGGAAGGGGGGGGQMLYIPGLGYIPLANLANIPGLNLVNPRGGGAAPAPVPEGERDWKGLSDMPQVLQDTIGDLFGALQEDGKSELTILMLGKGGVGKSSTLNSILNERAANVTAFQVAANRPTTFSRRIPKDGFVLSFIDTPSLLRQDCVSDGALEAVARVVSDKEIDAVLYLDRLDTYSVDPIDRALISGITRVLGPSIWNNTVICLTRASDGSVPCGQDFEDHVAAREAALRKAVASACGSSAEHVAFALVENSSHCPKNADGEKIVPGEVPWVADLLEKIVDVALNMAPYEYRPAEAAKKANPNRRRKWLIPLILAAQVGAKLLLDRVMDDDGCRGDSSGPFDPQTIEERRQELQEEKARSKKGSRGSKRRGAFEDDFIEDGDDGSLLFNDRLDEQDDDWDV